MGVPGVFERERRAAVHHEADARPIRVLVCVEPSLFGELLGDVLEAAGMEAVVSPGGRTQGDFDAALVTVVMADRARPRVVIELPDKGPHRGTAIVHTGGGVEQVRIDSVTSVIRILTERCDDPAPKSR